MKGTYRDRLYILRNVYNSAADLKRFAAGVCKVYSSMNSFILRGSGVTLEPISPGGRWATPWTSRQLFARAT